MKYLAPSAHLIEMIVSTAGHALVPPPASRTDQRRRTRLLNRVAVSLVGFYLSVNTNCFPITFLVERVPTLPASWGSTRNKDDNLGSASTSAGERYVR